MTLLFFLASGAVPIGLLYWLLLIFWLIFGVWTYWPPTGSPAGWRPLGGNLLLWILLALVGLELFGFPVGR